MTVRPQDSQLTLTGGAGGVLLDGNVYTKSALIADTSAPGPASNLVLVGGTVGVQAQTLRHDITASDVIVQSMVTNTSGTGVSRLQLTANGGTGLVQLEASPFGGCTLYAPEDGVGAGGVAGGREVQGLDKAAGREAVAADVAGHAAAAFERRDPGVDGLDSGEVVVGGDFDADGREGRVRLGLTVRFRLGPAVAVQLQGGGVAEDEGAAQGCCGSTALIIGGSGW